MAKYVELENNTVVNIIEANSAFVSQYPNKYIQYPTSGCKVGQTYLNGNFIDSPDYSLYLHINLTDGDGEEPIGILNDGIDSLHVNAIFRQTSESSSQILTMINNYWRVVIRDSDGLIYDIVKVTFVNGVADLYYKTTNKPAICNLLEKDLNEMPVIFNTIQYTIKIVGDTKFKVYRSL
jgi:hypothetical protein